MCCSYYNQENRSISSQGCSVIEVTPSSIKCGCNHMTDFMVFLETGLAVVRETNYDVFLALTQLTLSNLRYNIGFYFLAATGVSILFFGLSWLSLTEEGRRLISTTSSSCSRKKKPRSWRREKNIK